MSEHDLLITLNVIRTVILVTALFGLLVYRRVSRGVAICVAIALLLLNLAGLSIALTLVNHVHTS